MSAHRASLLACLLAVSNFALADTGEVSTSFSNSLATANASGEGKGGALCFDFDTFNAAKLEKEIDAQAYVAQLDQQLQSVPVAPGRHAIAGRISAIRVDICWPYVGFENTNKIKGTVSLSVAWKVDGVEIATAATHTQAKSSPGGLRGMLLAAYAENVRQLLGNPSLITALATPEKIATPVAEVAPVPMEIPAPQPAVASTIDGAIERPPVVAPVAAAKLPVALLQPGRQLRHTRTDAITVFALEGGAGVTVRATANISGEGMMALYASDGSLMLDVEGSGALDLEAILSLDDIYFLAVGRSQPSQPFTLKAEASEPDVHLAVFSNGVGYLSPAIETKTGKPYDNRSCWVEPGLKLRRMYPNGYEEVSLGRGGREFGTWKTKAGGGGAAERQVIFEGDSVIYRRVDGSAEDIVRSVEEIMDWHEEPKYFRYLCRAEDI